MVAGRSWELPTRKNIGRQFTRLEPGGEMRVGARTGRNGPRVTHKMKAPRAKGSSPRVNCQNTRATLALVYVGERKSRGTPAKRNGG